MSLIMASYMGAGGRIYSFEPGAQTSTIFMRNMARNLATNITLIKKAVSDEMCLINFAEDSAFGHISNDFNESVRNATAQVECTTLDAFVEDHDIPYCNFIKIDTEGFDHRVISGAKGIIANFDPVIYLEFSIQGMLYISNINPYEVLKQYLDTFRYVYLVNDVDGSLSLIDQANSLNVMNMILGKRGLICNLVMANHSLAS